MKPRLESRVRVGGPRRWRLLITIYPFFFLFIFLSSVFFPRLSFLLLDLVRRVGGTHRGTLLPTVGDSFATFTLTRSHTASRFLLFTQGGGKRDIASGDKKGNVLSRLLTRSFLNRFREAMHLLRNRLYTANLFAFYLHFH